MILKVYDDFPENIWDEGSECKVWIEGDNVCKAYKKISRITDLQKKLDLLNSLPEYEKEEIYGIIPSKNIYVTKQKKLKDWEQIFVEFYLSHHRRLKDWKPIIDNYLLSKGYTKYKKSGWQKGDVIINDLDVANIAMTDDNEIKIIDACLLYNGLRIS